MSSIASPSWSRISAASDASGRPDTFAEVTGSGPSAAARARGARVIRDPEADGRASAGEFARQASLGALGHHDRERTGPECAGEGLGGGRPGRELPGLAGLGEEQDHRPIGRPSLGCEQPLDRIDVGEICGEAVDRVGR